MAREKYCVGIDIGASAIKLCQLKRGKGGIMLDQFGHAPLAAGTVVDGAIMNPSRIVEAIQELRSTHKIRNKQAAISVSGHSVIIKKITVPQMTNEELEQNIQWEAEQFIPFDIADVNLDFQVVNGNSAQQGHMDVVLVAAKKDFINEYTSIIAEAGFEPMVCDVDAFAIENMFLESYESEIGETIALINVGATTTNINILNGAVSSFTRDLTIGGNSFTEEIQKQLNVTQEEAEALKLGGSTQNDMDAIVPQEVQRAIQTIADNVASELQRSFDFFSATSADPNPSQIYLTGGSSKLRALKQSIKTKIGVPVITLDPFRRINTEGHDPNYIASQSPCASVAVGLALRYLGDS